MPTLLFFIFYYTFQELIYFLVHNPKRLWQSSSGTASKNCHL